jgi:hypothetical protein
VAVSEVVPRPLRGVPRGIQAAGRFWTRTTSAATGIRPCMTFVYARVGSFLCFPRWWHGQLSEALWRLLAIS